MKSLGEFESVFRRALRDHYEFAPINVARILLITDLSQQVLEHFQAEVNGFLQKTLSGRNYAFEAIGRDDFSNWAELEAHLARFQPDFIVSYRLLRVNDQRITTSLGVYIDTLSQKTSFPVLVLPNPNTFGVEEPAATEKVMVATEHLYQDHSLINYAVQFVAENGKLILVHIEDEDTFEYYMAAIQKTPEIDDDLARQKIAEQLKADPRHYLESVVETLKTKRPDLEVELHVEFGHLITTYKELIDKQKVDLLVFHTKDDTQLAMHSLGYSLAIEFKEIPVLLI